MCTSNTMASICDSNICVRWHQNVITCKTTSRTLALYDICVIIRVSYPILNGSLGINKLLLKV
ncbi:hypothetical protein F383_35449 [Gossypium arboreum]|uniref:Uncharacterized protein n=1 Tax=Gossypium arboreum TaxID=29729 RepID=A0A0B0N7K1_GOSAR|nr:hypothetical protein F383_35449 [Gossypium arboreum]